jgi:hypothetical protein
MYWSGEIQLIFDQIEDSLNGLIKIISYEKQYLDKLTSDPKTNPNTLNIQTQKVNKLFMQYSTINQLIEPLKLEYEKQYQRGKKIGYENAKAKYEKKGEPSRYYDKEAFRAAHELQVKNDLKHLY